MTASLLEHQLSRLSDFVTATMGLNFPRARRGDLERQANSAAIEFGYADVEAFVQWLLSSVLTQGQIERLAAHLTISETYFCREPRVLEALRDSILPEMIRSGIRATVTCDFGARAAPPAKKPTQSRWCCTKCCQLGKTGASQCWRRILTLTCCAAPRLAYTATGRSATRRLLHYLRASILQEQNRDGEAKLALQRVLYLDPDFVLAHFALGILAQRQGHTPAARKSFKNALALLSGFDADDILLEADGLTAGRLRAIMRDTLQTGALTS